MATPQIRRANRVSAAATRCADDTEATCTSTALNDVRALFERAKAILTVADAVAPCIATKLLFHLDLESSGKPTKAKAESTLSALHAAVADAAAPFAHTLPAANTTAGRNLVDTFVTMLQTLATHEAEVFAEAGASSPVVTPAVGAGGGRGDRRGGDRGGRDGGDRRSRSPRDRDQRDRRSREEMAQRPVCETWRRDGKCKAHSEKKCKDKRHPDMWKNIGEEAYEADK